MNVVLIKKIALLIGIFGLVVFLFFFFKKDSTVYSFSTYPTRTIVFPNGYTLTAYRATTETQREQGLSGTHFLSAKDGMVFEFPYENQWYFWMKDMTIPIDIIWISKDMTVVHIEKNLSPDTFPNSFGPKSNALYVLETKAGLSEKVNLNNGDKIIFND